MKLLGECSLVGGVSLREEQSQDCADDGSHPGSECVMTFHNFLHETQLGRGRARFVSIGGRLTTEALRVTKASTTQGHEGTRRKAKPQRALRFTEDLKGINHEGHEVTRRKLISISS